MKTSRKPLPRGALAKRIRLLQAATGLSDESCRQHLHAGTTPANPLIAAAWKRAMAKVPA